jgi:hypothetical protein
MWFKQPIATRAQGTAQMLNLTIVNVFDPESIAPVVETVESILEAADCAEHYLDQYDGNAEFSLISTTGTDETDSLHRELSARDECEYDSAYERLCERADNAEKAMREYY